MNQNVIVDTGPLVALLNRSDRAHGWTLQTLPTMAPPLITCEAVLTEATYITRNLPGARAALIEMVGEGFLSIGIYVADHHSALLAMIKRYTNVPMSLADACLVRLAELHPKSLVMTLDSDFSVYRKNGRQRIGVLRP